MRQNFLITKPTTKLATKLTTKFLAILLGCMFLWALIVPLNSAKAEEEFISINTAKLANKERDIQQLKELAVSKALSTALQGATAKILPAQVLALNLEFLYGNIFNNPMDYIISYKVIKSIQNEADFLIAVESAVNIRLLKRTLAEAEIMQAEKEKPVILFFIYEKTPLELTPRYWWDGQSDDYQSETEKIIIDKMLQKQFLVIGNNLQRPDPSFYNIVFSSVNDVSAAISLGRKVKADMIIMGSAIASPTANRMGTEKSFKAKIVLTAHDVETNETAFVSDIQAAATSHTNEDGYARALANAARLSADDLIEKLEDYRNEYLKKEQSFDVKVSGNNFLLRFIAFKQRLEEIRRVEAVLQKEAGTNSALLEIRYKGRNDQFANTLMLNTFDTFGVEIIEVTDNMLDIRLVDKAP